MTHEANRIHSIEVKVSPIALKLEGENLHKSQAYAQNPHKAILEFAKHFIDKIHLSSDKIVVATFRQPEKTAGGIYRTDQSMEEDIYQGAAGLILKMGSEAFKDDARTSFGGFSAKPYDWVTYRAVHGNARQFAGLHCRILQDAHIDAVIEDPTLVW